MKMLKKMKHIIKLRIVPIYNSFKKYWGLIFIPLILLVLDGYVRYNVKDINIPVMGKTAPNLFTWSYIIIIIGITLLLKGKLRKIFVGINLSIFLILFLVNIIYYKIFNSFFSFNIIAIAGEGTGYIKDIIKTLDLKLIIITMFIIILIFLSIKFLPKTNKKIESIVAIIIIIVGLGLRVDAYKNLGSGVDPLEWNAWSFSRNIYNSYTDSKKSLKVSGFVEYVARDFYLSVLSKKSVNKEKYVNYLSNYFSSNENILYDHDDYNGIFENKNIIIILMESIDSWLVNDDVMPNLNNLMKTGLNFTNHFSIIYGGGATFNSEFMINTGYMTPFNGKLAAYSYSENAYSNSLANLFKKKGYSVNNFHYNVGTFYNRGDMSIAFGYEKYNSAQEMGYGSEALHDTLFMNESKLKDMMLPKNKFMTFFTTYSGHMPYTLDNYLCNSLSSKYEIDKNKIMENENINCAHIQAKETDNFFELLIEALKEKEIYNDTVIIGVTDHYSYAYPDQDYIFEQKGYPDENFIHNVPFFIWSSDISSKEITEINSNLDVLPTIASLFNLDYNPIYYLGNNILSNNYQEFIFFSDYSWCNGDTYYKDGKVIFGDNITMDEIKENSQKVNKILDVNSKVLESNYFANIK